ncbi:hypothetical protein CRG98_041667 [Punica granatum]|uniref:Reverse transcriptase domain-containing protein n=1 Tax=Punica granatum TaxID=22663 RepID=A0A2I0I1T8_PUNGR|nr:hypothetical protein CRG98_041667 [Punica granatum]
MCRVFAPIMDQALVYIGDNLLFNPTGEAHVHLLRRFSEIVKPYGIMLFEKKMVIGQREINFLGMQLANGQYQLEPHEAQELLKYPEELLTKKQVQQFLDTVNYLRNFLLKIAKLTRPLEKMLKKDAPAWGPTQPKVIKELKAQLQSLPPLQIPFTKKRILQTDASDRYWGAVLIEELQGKRHIYGYRSGKFKLPEQYYYSMFKEILAVINETKKFEVHLIRHRFRVKMDMSSFPKMLQFKHKQLPRPKLLRWAEWFSKFDFEVKRIIGKHNTLADFLSMKE